ncbi:adaptor protein MecA [Zongyangia hominis]|uniref:Adaptor protein MecA n=1 Tax=Zongyangia hominis TaxID=2763677 RepID=A0A926IAP3_9FIRM|nr:adaptor protein MecA [Zongyangia hominis]MBC8570421.1 adaptor protein MecA [Zongyangia hominis]
MNIQLISKNKLKVTLSGEDLKGLGISYDSLDYSDPHTKEVLLHILGKAKTQAGFAPGRQKLFIEVYPSSQNGCVIYFTPLFDKNPAIRRYRVKRSIGEPAVYRFGKIDTVIDASVRLFQLMGHRIFKSSLYRMGRAYYLAIYPLDGISGKTAGFLSEYAPLAGRGHLLVSYLQEHGHAIVEDRAIDTLSYYLA